MTREQLKFLDKLLDDGNVRGKKQIEQVIWLNTNLPKYKRGDVVKFNAKGNYCYGVPVKEFKGVVTRTYSNAREQFHYYEIEAEIEIDGKIEKQTYYPTESEIVKSFIGKNITNKVVKKDKYSQSMDISSVTH